MKQFQAVFAGERREYLKPSWRKLRDMVRSVSSSSSISRAE